MSNQSGADHRPLIGIALMVLATAFLAAKDGLGKSFLDQVGPVHMIWFQYVGNFAVMALISLPRYGSLVVRPKPFGLQLVRGALSAATVSTLYWSLSYIPLADATAMFMLSPIVVALLSPFLIGEKLDLPRKAAIAAGFCGVLLVLKPGAGGQAFGYYIGLAAGVLMGLFFIANRKLAALSPPLLNVTHNALVGGIVLSLFLPLFWHTPPQAVWGKLGALIGLAVVGQALMISAFMFAPAGVIAPFTYAMLVFAAIIGYFAFGTFPDTLTWAGIALIVGAGLYIAHRERQLAARPA